MNQQQVADHMGTVKYPAAREVIEVLKRADLRVLHVGSPAWDPWRPAGVYYFDDLDLLIRDADLAAFRTAIESAGYRLILDDPEAMEASEAPGDLVDEMLLRPTGPYVCYSREVKWPSDLWISFRTTRRHGRLILVDLEDWFAAGEGDTVTVMKDTQIERAPIWGLLLWQASDVTSKAADCCITKDHVDKLRLIAAQPQVDWDRVLSTAQKYDAEYLARAARVADMSRALARHCRVDPALLVEPNASFGAGILYETRYAFEAVEDFYPGTIPQSVLQGVRTGTGQRSRKIWGYADLDYSVRYGMPQAPAGVAGEAPFTIRQQIEQYGDLSGADFFTQNIVTPAISNLPPFGKWTFCEPDTLDRLFAPL
jgi:hypothetical protein